MLIARLIGVPIHVRQTFFTKGIRPKMSLS